MGSYDVQVVPRGCDGGERVIVALSIVALLLLIAILIGIEDRRQRTLHPLYEVMAVLADAPGPDFELGLEPIPDDGRYYTVARHGDVLTIVRRQK
jgi:hypothetical protein